MVKKPRKPTLGKSEKELAAAIKDSAQQIWLAGLGVFSKTQEEGNKVFEALVKEGEAIRSRSSRIVADVRLGEISSKATGTWGKLEQVFENRVERALKSLGVPTQKDIDTLTKRIDKLTSQVGTRTAATKPKPAPTKRRPAAKKAK